MNGWQALRKRVYGAVRFSTFDETDMTFPKNDLVELLGLDVDGQWLSLGRRLHESVDTTDGVVAF